MHERGSIAVFFGLLLPVVLLLLLLVVDVGNWFVHKRHLQMQADAAALAGGAHFADCFSPDPAVAASASPSIIAAAAAYAGDANLGSTYNRQLGGGASRIHTRFNSTTFFRGSYVDPDVETQPPCETPSLMLDVKQTEADVPYVLGALLDLVVPGAETVVPAINARARVQLKRSVIVTDSLPLAVPEVNPKFVTATFVDESGAIVAGPVSLSGPTASGSLNAWSGSATIPVTAGSKVGVRIGVGQVAGACGAANKSGGAGYVCFDYSSFGRGLVAVEGYAPSGTPDTPGRAAFEVWPISACAGSPFFSEFSTGGASSCSTGVQAVVRPASGEIDPAKVKSFKATVKGAGFNQTADLTFAGGVWTTGYAFALPLDGGPYDVSLEWQYTGSKQTHSNVQQLYSASDDAGPLKVVRLTGGSGANSPYALPAGWNTVTVSVALEGSLQLSTSLVMLRLTGGSRTSALACDGTGFDKFRTAVVQGCKTSYQINTAGYCPNPSPPPGPADCAPTQTGDGAGPTLQGLDERYAGCPPYSWPDVDLETDPRVVTLMVTDFSALGGSGTTTVPVTNVARFYIAGWTGSKCAQPAPPVTVKKGAIWGYFVKDVSPDPYSGGTEACDPLAITPCVPVLVK